MLMIAIIEIKMLMSAAADDGDEDDGGTSKKKKVRIILIVMGLCSCDADISLLFSRTYIIVKYDA